MTDRRGLENVANNSSGLVSAQWDPHMHNRSARNIQTRPRIKAAQVVPNYTLTPRSFGEIAPQLPALPETHKRRELEHKFILANGSSPWTCRVESVLPDRFTAISRLESGEVKRVRFRNEHVSERDRALIVDGATFYWAFGVDRSDEDNPILGSVLVFPRRARVSTSQYERAMAEANELIDLGGGNPFGKADAVHPVVMQPAVSPLHSVLSTLMRWRLGRK